MKEGSLILGLVVLIKRISVRGRGGFILCEGQIGRLKTRRKY